MKTFFYRAQKKDNSNEVTIYYNFLSFLSYAFHEIAVRKCSFSSYDQVNGSYTISLMFNFHFVNLKAFMERDNRKFETQLNPALNSNPLLSLSSLSL